MGVISLMEVRLIFQANFSMLLATGFNSETGYIEEEEVRQLALQHKPKLIICGASAYPRQIDFAAFKRIADEVGAKSMLILLITLA